MIPHRTLPAYTCPNPVTMPPVSPNRDQHIPPVPGSPSQLRTWLFDAETSDDDDSYFSFPNRPYTSSTTSTKPGSEIDTILDIDSEPDTDGNPSSTPCPIPTPGAQNQAKEDTKVAVELLIHK